MRFLTILVLLITLVSCKKDPILYTFIGTAIDKNSKLPIANLLLKFSQKEINTNALNPNFIPVGETTTDANGNYTFIFERQKILELKIELSHPNYYSVEKIISSSDLSTENENAHDFKLESQAWVKVRLLNSFVEPNEQLNFYKHNVKEGCYDCCVNGYTIVKYTTPDTTFICPVVGDVRFKYSYGEVVAGTSETDSIYCTKNDTTHLVIIY